MYFYQEIKHWSKYSRRLLQIIVTIWILFAVLLIFLDLPISIFLVDYDSSWAKFVALYGEIPGHIVISISLFLLLCERVKLAGWSYNLFFLLGLIINSVFLLGIILTFFPNYTVELKEGSVFTGIILICQVMAINRLKNEKVVDSPKVIKFAKISLLLAILNPLLFVQVFKFLWGRTRFRDLNENYNEFTQWFVPQGVTGHKSFPSGHTAMGWMVLPLLFLLPKSGGTRRVFQGLIFAWGTFIAFGRIVIGAHYASDVLFSSGVAFFVYLLLSNHWKRNRSLKEIQNRNQS
ncbi:MAG: phosphatase PAP2 family protein [Candidatus Hodarchaeales archaeon]|jgi:membrane-associated PAP2 superfamily phosphatase